jgi:hypothetical protein
MKATISPTGTLDVIPETPIEAYALRQWWSNFQNGDHTSFLHVRVNPNSSTPASEGGYE